MRKGEKIKCICSNENKVYSFEIYPKLDKKTFNKAFDDKSLNNFRLVSITKKDGVQTFFETTNRIEMEYRIDKFLAFWT